MSTSAQAISLRPYQAAAIDGLRSAIGRGKKRVLLCLPTGGGKTTVAAEVIRGAVAKGRRVFFLAHRRELIDQCSKRLDLYGIDHGVVMANHNRFRPWAPVQVASVPTLVRRVNDPHRRLEADVIFIDEAHHARAASYQQILDAYPQAIALGLTATPWRSDGRGLGSLFDDLVVGATVAELTREGFLVPVSGFAFERPDVSAVRVTAGEYDAKQLATVTATVVRAGHVVEEWQRHAAGLTTVVFALNISDSRELVEQFRAAGVTAEHVDAETPKEERDAILGRVASGQTRVISNMGILTEGWDLPSVRCVVLARPTKSLSLALQMVGRGLRPLPCACGAIPHWSRLACACGAPVAKRHCLIHDHAGVLLEHGLPDEDRDMTLDDRRGQPKPRPARVCDVCFRVLPPGESRCIECGTAFAQVGQKAEQQVEVVEGEAVALEDIRKRREQLGLLSAWSDDQLLRAKAATREEKAAEYLRLVEVQTRKGFKPGFVSNQFREVFGHWPRFTDDELAAAQPATSRFLKAPPFSAGAPDAF